MGLQCLNYWLITLVPSGQLAKVGQWYLGDVARIAVAIPPLRGSRHGALALLQPSVFLIRKREISHCRGACCRGCWELTYGTQPMHIRRSKYDLCMWYVCVYIHIHVWGDRRSTWGAIPHMLPTLVLLRWSLSLELGAGHFHWDDRPVSPREPSVSASPVLRSQHAQLCLALHIGSGY